MPNLAETQSRMLAAVQAYKEAVEKFVKMLEEIEEC